MQDDTVMYSASGDQSVGVWDTATAQLICSCVGHCGSVKSVTPVDACPDVLASAGRDGMVAVWDVRCQGQWSARLQRNVMHPVLQIQVGCGCMADWLPGCQCVHGSW